MKDTRAAIRYAKAIMDISVDNKVTDIVENDMRAVVKTISDSRELKDLLASPIVKGEDKKNAISMIFKGSHAITDGMIKLLVDNKRIGMLNEVALKFIILNEHLKGQDIAIVTTAVQLTKDLEKKVLEKVAKITGNKVTIENRLDESIIGGFVLRVGDLQFDASVANKLSNLKREFTNSL